MLNTSSIHLFGDPASSRFFLQPVDDHDLEGMEAEAKALEEASGSKDWCIAAVPVSDWNHDLAPWPAPPVFGKQAFGDGAEETLRGLLEDVIPELDKKYPAKDRRYYLCGYSLAGFFSLWAASKTDRFAAVAAVSPSVWYPGWLDYAAENPMKTPRIYLSLGDKEEKTKNPVMAKVGEAIREQHRILENTGVETCLEWNPGNHFKDFDKRMARGLAWILKE